MTIKIPQRKYPDHPAPTSEIIPTKSSVDNSFLDSWIDGILILTETGKCIHSNSLGKSLCDRIAQDYPSTDLIPQEIWHTCQILIHNRQGLPRHLIIAESELKLKRSHEHVRIRARWLNNTTEPHILVILENQTQSRQTLAITETIKYKLSPREADVWSLHRIGYTYQEIAAELHIALNTVKKHMKNAYAKQQLFSMIDESYIDELAG